MKEYKEHEQRMRVAQTAISLAQNNKHFLQNEPGEICGCACCGHTFRANAIKKFEGDSAICPVCGMKTIIPGNLGIRIEQETLQKYSRILYEKLSISAAGMEMLFPLSLLSWMDARLERIRKFGKELQEDTPKKDAAA